MRSAAAWSLTAFISLACMAWWRLDYRAWAALSGGLVVVATLWLMWRICSAGRHVGGNMVYMVLAAPAGMLVYHLAQTLWADGEVASGGMQGALAVSMMFQLFLVASAVMLCQDLLSVKSRRATIVICAAAMMVGSVVWLGPSVMRLTVSLTGLAGAAIWAVQLWPGHDTSRWRKHFLAVAALLPAVAAGGYVAWQSPQAAAVAAGAAGAAIIVSSPLCARRGWLQALIPAVVAVVAAVLVWRGDVSRRVILLGEGEHAFEYLSAADSGLQVLTAVVGWPAVGIALVTGTVAIVAQASSAASSPHRLKAIGWVTAAICSAGAMLAPTGLFVAPAVVVFALAWGMLPTACGRQVKARSGVWAVGTMILLMFLLGLARHDGLVVWSVVSFGGNDAMLHLLAGFVLAMVIAWQIGGVSVRLGLCGIVLAALSGGAAEYIQWVASQRSVQLSDWFWHAVGSAAAIVPYVLVMLSRWCESAEARPGPGV